MQREDELKRVNEESFFIYDDGVFVPSWRHREDFVL